MNKLTPYEIYLVGRAAVGAFAAASFAFIFRFSSFFLARRRNSRCRSVPIHRSFRNKHR
jgi:hypothetical protein